MARDRGEISRSPPPSPWGSPRSISSNLGGIFWSSYFLMMFLLRKKHPETLSEICSSVFFGDRQKNIKKFEGKSIETKRQTAFLVANFVETGDRILLCIYIYTIYIYYIQYTYIYIQYIYICGNLFNWKWFVSVKAE
jgi:hypothetical protein